MTMAKQSLKEWKEQRAAHACDLFPKEYDFLRVCSCLECRQKIKMLKEFEEEMKSRRIQLKECLYRLQVMRIHCVHLSTVLEWTRNTFDLLHKVLERNSGPC
ncbi:unnamed protein product [Cuscuta europaea]|uniref:Uncharacterized protein n=1 Tax=Cuscuta europaea TaxID=41803 RepID=A0A9P0ZAG9_CUSEU|nr:unnamed protein product [Cuscuta europaea]